MAGVATASGRALKFGAMERKWGVPAIPFHWLVVGGGFVVAVVSLLWTKSLTESFGPFLVFAFVYAGIRYTTRKQSRERSSDPEGDGVVYIWR